MYVYYEHHKDAKGRVMLTELVLSSYGNGKLSINFKHSPEEKTLFDLSKMVLKSIAVGLRSFDPASNVWTYMNGTGVGVLKQLQGVHAAIFPLTLIEVQNLASQALNHFINLKPFGSSKTLPKPEEFFYQHTQPARSAELTKDQVAAKLLPLLEVSKVSEITKHAYRRAALRLHPDRNNGNGAMMSELNMLWSVYNAS